MSLPTASTPGYGTFRGRVACKCLIAWLPVYEVELLRRGIIKHHIDIYQLTGLATDSAGVHGKGGAADIAQRSKEALIVSRNMGAAGWARDNDPNDGQPDFDPHQHLVLNGCPHNAPARYQIPALEARRNGLGYNGRGGPDDGPRAGVHWPLRTYKEGIAWAKALQKPKTSLRFATFNLPGEDKIPHGASRILAAMPLLKTAPPALIGWNELVGIKRADVASDFAHAVDAALGADWLLVKPTKLLNENYVSFDRRLLELVHQYDDSILEAPTGGRHLTRVVFKVKATGLVFAVGQTHLVNGSTSAHERDRQTQAADALASMKAVSAKHGNCPFIIQGDMNTPKALTALVTAGMKLTRTYADNSTSRADATYTNIAKTKPSTEAAWIIDQSYVSAGFYCVGYSVRRKLDVAGNFVRPRPSDHDVVVSSVRI